MAALPNAAAVQALLKHAPGPSPWWCRDPIGSAHGTLSWEKVSTSGLNVLLDQQGNARLALPMYVWFQALADHHLLLWWRPTRRQDDQGNKAITVQRIDLDRLQVLSDVAALKDARLKAPRFLLEDEFCATAQIDAALAPGSHNLTLPSAFDSVPEFIAVTDNPALESPAGGAKCCLYVVNPATRRVEVIPQDWFNAGDYDYGYQWITCAVRDPASRHLVVGGFRLPAQVLDERGRQVVLKYL